MLIGRGSSGNAAILGRYLVERGARRPACVGAPVLRAHRKSHRSWPPRGRTGSWTRAVTNDPDTMFAEVAELVYPLDAGYEFAYPRRRP